MLSCRMWRAGVCVIATSNRPPEELYKDGLNRHVYLPKFEKMLHKYCRVLNLTDRHAVSTPVVDYRLGGEALPSLFIKQTPPKAARASGPDQSLQATWEAIVGPDDRGIARQAPANIQIGFGRQVAADAVVGLDEGSVGGMGMAQAGGPVRAAWFSADNLLEAALGAGDYLLLSRKFDVVFVRCV